MTALGAEAPWALLLVLLPLAGGTAAFLTDGRGARLLALGSGLLTSVAAVALAVQVRSQGTQRYPIGGWEAPLGIDLRADGFSALMLLMTAAVGLAVTVYAPGYFAPTGTSEAQAGARTEGAAFWPLWLFLWAALDALFLSADAFNLYVTLELVTLAAVALVAQAGTPAATTAALRYLLTALLGSLLYLLGVGLLYALTGALDIEAIGRLLPPGATAWGAIALITAGLLLKTALFPVHFWLPPAHASAPAPVSAVLSALVVTASYYLLSRLWFTAFAPVVTGGAGVLLGALGALAILWGSIQALLARRLKLLIAYSTVAQLGYLFLVFALAGREGGAAAWYACALFAVSHAWAKAALFLASGTLIRALGHDRIAEMDGAGAAAPAPLLTMGLASVTLMGLPPSGAFVAKWMLISAAIAQGHVWLAVVIVAGGVLAAAYLFRVLGRAFAPAPIGSARVAPPRAPRGMEGTALALALAALLMGLATRPALSLLEIGAPVPAAPAQEPRP